MLYSGEELEVNGGGRKEAALGLEAKAEVEEEQKAADNEVQKLSEELMAYEDYMKFYQIPYYEGQSAAAPPSNPAPETVELWSFDDVSGEV